MKNEEVKTLPIDPIIGKERILAIYLTYRGFGFVVFEDPQTVIDWGHASVEYHDPEIFRKRIKASIEANQIERVLSYSAHGRPTPIQRNIQSLKSICKDKKVKCTVLSKEEINTVFESFGSYTKYQRAGLVAAYLPDLAYKLPPKRKPWMSEDLRMSIFDSACLALTYFYLKK